MKNTRLIALTVIALSALASIIAAAFLAAEENGNWGFFLVYAALVASFVTDDEDEPESQPKP